MARAEGKEETMSKTAVHSSRKGDVGSMRETSVGMKDKDRRYDTGKQRLFSMRGVSRLLALLLASVMLLNACGQSKKETADGSTAADKKEETADKEKVDAEKTDADEEDDADWTPGPDEARVFDVHQMLASHKHLKANVEAVFTIPYPTQHSVSGMQGGWFDGKRYFYQGCIGKKSYEKENEDIIVKYDTLTQTIVKESDVLHLGHINDMDYNSKLGLLMVTNSIGRFNTVSFIDPNTLTIVRNVELNNGLSGISYSAKRDRYAALLGSNGQAFTFYDSNFNELQDPLDPSTLRLTGYTTQGCACDDDYYYVPLWTLGEAINCIMVYDWNGTFVSVIDLMNLDLEAEDMTIVGNDVYISCASQSGGVVYRISQLWSAD